MGVLRFFLALSVIKFHSGVLSGFPLLNGNLAVQAFYYISGFYMALILHEKYQPEKATYFQFISSRFLRIFPAYFMILLLTILLWFWANYYYGSNSSSPFALWAENWTLLDWQAKFFLVFSHLTLFGQDGYVFLGLSDGGGLYFDPIFQASRSRFWHFMFVPQAWSLSMELYFYLLAPFLVRRTVPVLAAMIALSLALRFVLANHLGWRGDPWSYRFFPSELALFLCGAGAYRVYRAVRAGKMDAQIWIGWGMLGVAVGFALQVSNRLNLTLMLNNSPGELARWLNVGFVVAVLLASPFLFRFTQHSKVDRHLGELSYPMYLCHFLVIWLFYLMQIPDGTGRTAGVLSVTLLLSTVLYWWVDRKADDFRHRKFSVAH